MQENYRPISLLQISYKIFASILKQRIEQGVEDELQKTQFGFRQIKAQGKQYTVSEDYKNTQKADMTNSK